MNKEILMKPILDNVGYFATNDGRIWSEKRKKFLMPTKKKNGYLQVNLWKNGKPSYSTIHRLVYAAFHGEIPQGLQVNHCNEIKTDNRIENLCLMSAKENANYGTRNSRMSRNKQKELVMLDVQSGSRYYFPSRNDAADYFNYKSNVFRGAISEMKKRGKNRIKIKGIEYLVKGV